MIIRIMYSKLLTGAFLASQAAKPSGPYNPTHFFALMQKSKQKKSRLRPLRSKNYRSKG